MKMKQHHAPGVGHSRILLLPLLLLQTLTPTANSQENWFCGTSFPDASAKCLTPCPSGTGCPSGENCYSDTTCDVSTRYCGVNEYDANTRCMQPCPSGGGCPVGEACFLGTSCSPGSSNSGSSLSGSGGSFGGFDTAANQSGGVSGEVISDIDSSSSSSNNNNNNNIGSEMNTKSTSTSNTGIDRIEETLTSASDAFNDKLFMYETPMSEWLPSTVYRFEGFFEGFKVMHQVGVAGKKIYTGGDCDHCHMYGLVNVAAFLAQAMKETIRYDACDENSWDRVGDLLMYPLSNACGQLGQSYQDYHCSEEEAHMECAVDPEMTITAVTHAKWYGAPGPLKCGPKSLYPQTGYWDYAYECNNPWANPPESCTEYEGQKAGKAINDAPYPNAAGRTDVEGCCWWGRGVIQTSGVCNFGKLNYYLGKRAFLEGRQSRYPEIDFCRDPEAICTSEEHRELKWIAGFFYWVDQVQPYDQGGWSYMDQLHKFVDNGMEGEEFINAVSGIVNRGCHNPPCGTGELDGGPERAENFFKILKEIEFSFVDVHKTPAPTSLPPTPPPTRSPITMSPVYLPTEVSYVCGDHANGESSPSNISPEVLEVTFDYEVHNGIDTTVGDALKDVKGSILSDVAENLGCYEVPSSSRRKLQGSNGGIIGMEASRTDLPDPDAAGCIMEVRNNEPTSCTPTKGGFTLFAETGTSEASLNSTTDYLKSLLKSGMDSGRYESNLVVKAVYVGEREAALNALYPEPKPTVVVKESPPPNNSALKIALYCLAGACGLLLCLLCLLIPSTRRRKNQNHDVEMALADYMQSSQRDPNRKPPNMSYQQRPQQRPPIQRRVTEPRKPMKKQPGTPFETSSDSEDSGEQMQLARGITNFPPPPPPRGQRRASCPPVSTIGATGQFYMQQDAMVDDNAFDRPPDPSEVILDESYQSAMFEPGQKMEYIPNAGVESVDGGSMPEEMSSDNESYHDVEAKPFARRQSNEINGSSKSKRKSKKKSKTPERRRSSSGSPERHRSKSKKGRKKRVEEAKDKYFEHYEERQAVGMDRARSSSRRRSSQD